MILVTGGLGFIGSHVACQLLQQNYEICIVDNLSNSDETVRKAIFEITNKNFEFYKGDILDSDFINNVFKKNKINTVVHLAGLKSVPESFVKPISYYENNINGTINLLKNCKKHSIKNFIFSSSATVYSKENTLPWSETQKVEMPYSIYGKTKYIIEHILQDASLSNPQFNVISLRYFNPIGAHKSGLIGDSPTSEPNNLIPYINEVALKKRDHLKIYGNDFNTKDGTGVRDYIHVEDLATGHLMAINKIDNFNHFNVFNLGTGKGYSVLDIVNAFEEVSGLKIPYKFYNRREGDLAQFWADPSKAEEVLEWNASKDLNEMLKDAWNFIKQ